MTHSPSVRVLEDGRTRISASTSIADIARDAIVRASYPALSAACDSVGNAAVRERSTLGGNLCQRPRCSYFVSGVACLKNGGAHCLAIAGDNARLAILEGGPCYIVHPSDTAVALAALGATLELTSAAGRREVTTREFYTLPSERLDQESVIEPGEAISAILLSSDAANGIQHFHKLPESDADPFALVSIAGCKRVNGDVSIVLGGVAPRPWRINSSVEEDVSSGGLDEDAIATLAERALYDAEPLSENAYKIDLAASLIRQVIGALA